MFKYVIVIEKNNHWHLDAFEKSLTMAQLKSFGIKGADVWSYDFWMNYITWISKKIEHPDGRMLNQIPHVDGKSALKTSG